MCFGALILVLCPSFKGHRYKCKALIFLSSDQYRGVDQDPVEGDQRRADGHGAQAVRKGAPISQTHLQYNLVNVYRLHDPVCVRGQEMKTLDKEVRVWNVYAGLEATVKNMLTSLRAVNELQNSAVRERHWQQLMNTTGVRGGRRGPGGGGGGGGGGGNLSPLSSKPL